MSKVNNPKEEYAWKAYNTKPDIWYDKYIRKEQELVYNEKINPTLKDYNYLKEDDRKIDIYQYIQENNLSSFENIPQDVLKEYFDIISGKAMRDKTILFVYNHFEGNRKILEILKARYENIKRKRIYTEIFNNGCKNNLIFREYKLKICEHALSDGFLITHQLDELNDELNNCQYCFKREKDRKKENEIQETIQAKLYNRSEEHTSELQSR